MNLSRYILATLCAVGILVSGAQAEIADQEFQKAMENYLKTEDGQERLGKAVQEYFQQQQQKARAQQEKDSRKALEEQFANPIKAEVGDSPSKGPKDAKVTIIEFSDFECPFCSRGDATMKQVLKEYPNDVRVVFKNLPLPFHKNAEPAAVAALAAGEQGKFWEMHDVLFANQKKLNEKLYLDTAKKLGLDMDKFKADLKSEKLKKQVKDDAALARKVGISGTPGFLVNGVAVKGAYPFDHFKMIIDRWLSEDPTKAAA